MNTHFVKLSKPKKSDVYDTYWNFAVKRHNVFTNKQIDLNGPWTDDPVIRNYRFTNVFRASDRVSQYLIDLQYKDFTDNRNVFFRTLLFKIFNKIETFELLEKEMGVINYETFSFEKYNSILSDHMQKRQSIYSGAYIMPSAGSVFGHKYKHTNHLALLSKMMEDEIYLKIKDCKKLEDIYKIIISYPSFGAFLAFQYTIDLNYSTISDFSENDFVVAGPGAKNGILKCFDSLGEYSFSDVIKMMVDQQEDECIRMEIELPTLWGRKLQLIDCQNLFCEVDKYLRVTNPNVGGNTNRKRIKQKYSKSKGGMSFFFPPKWNINHKIENICPKIAKEDMFL